MYPFYYEEKSEKSKNLKHDQLWEDSKPNIKNKNNQNKILTKNKSSTNQKKCSYKFLHRKYFVPTKVSLGWVMLFDELYPRQSKNMVCRLPEWWFNPNLKMKMPIWIWWDLLCFGLVPEGTFNSKSKLLTYWMHGILSCINGNWKPSHLIMDKD
jgi:hypothetical protein